MGAETLAAGLGACKRRSSTKQSTKQSKGPVLHRTGAGLLRRRSGGRPRCRAMWMSGRGWCYGASSSCRSPASSFPAGIRLCLHGCRGGPLPGRGLPRWPRPASASTGPADVFRGALRIVTQRASSRQRQEACHGEMDEEHMTRSAPQASRPGTRDVSETGPLDGLCGQPGKFLPLSE
jgi:hypothetical protein